MKFKQYKDEMMSVAIEAMYEFDEQFRNQDGSIDEDKFESILDDISSEITGAADGAYYTTTQQSKDDVCEALVDPEFWREVRFIQTADYVASYIEKGDWDVCDVVVRYLALSSIRYKILENY